MEALGSSRDFGMALKVIKKQRLGFAFTTSPDRITDIINDALQGADWTAPDEYVDIPDFRPASEVLVIDENIKNTKEDDIIKNALLLEKAALDFDTRIKKVRTAEIAIATAKTTIVNSKGINISYESGYITASVSAMASDRQDSQMGWDFTISRRLSDIDFISIARSASKKAIDLLGAKKISPVKVPVILDSSVASDFLDILSASLSAEAVQKKRSFLAGKAGKKIMSPLVNIIDDGIMPWGTGTKPVDDEGVPAMKKTIVSGGMLQGFIHNTYTANKEGVMSTGNASRKSFKGLPNIEITNLYIEPKETLMSHGDTKDNENYPSPIPLLQGEGARGRVSESTRIEAQK
ncbi:MAG: TldD/PmbA family protein, partial [Candidatus Mariimomonas ferrooxydans]